jgi:ribosomal protein S18 acetylase RimI-like enzyme
MREITQRKDFLPAATWLAVREDEPGKHWLPVGTIQGLRTGPELGAIQNIGIIPDFRGLGLGSVLIWHALVGFASSGCRQVSLEVTVQNSAAIRLYERLGFSRAETVFKVADVPYG